MISHSSTSACLVATLRQLPRRLMQSTVAIAARESSIQIGNVVYGDAKPVEAEPHRSPDQLAALNFAHACELVRGPIMANFHDDPPHPQPIGPPFCPMGRHPGFDVRCTPRI
jgi:hypothetical protein